MLPNAVKIAATASVRMECEFWTEDDGWKGACVQLSVAVHGSNFEEAKKNMEAALQAAVESVLRDRENGSVSMVRSTVCSSVKKCAVPGTLHVF
jgi:predicted RNase H-like HicB family nuclease